MKRYTGFSDLLETQNIQFSDRPAFCYDEGGTVRTVTYAEWYGDVCTKARFFARESITCAGIVCDGSYDALTAVFAANLAGLQIVMLEGTLTEDARNEAACLGDAEAIYVRGRLVRTGYGGVRDGRGKILFFTSGTTSRSKAVVLTDASLMSSTYNGGSLLALTPADRMLCILPLAHVFGFVCSLLWPLTFGACVALSRGPRHYIDDCAYYRPSVISLVPLLMQFFLKYNVMNDELKTILVGAGDCPAPVLEAVRKTGRHISFGYGMTETSSGIAMSVGDDPYAMTVCPDDTVTIAADGEILVQVPPCIMQGYYKDPAATEAVLRDGVLYTGDFGRFDENGCLHITGRKKEILVFADGTKIFLPEYEAVLARCLGTAELAVICRDGKPVLVMKQDERTKKQVLDGITALMKQETRGRQITDVVFVQGALPRTASGKIRRWELEKEIIENDKRTGS